MDPIDLLSQKREEHLVRVAILHKAAEIEGQKKLDEIKLASQLTGMEIAKFLGAIL